MALNIVWNGNNGRTVEGREFRKSEDGHSLFEKVKGEWVRLNPSDYLPQTEEQEVVDKLKAVDAEAERIRDLARADRQKQTGDFLDKLASRQKMDRLEKLERMPSLSRNEDYEEIINHPYHKSLDEHPRTTDGFLSKLAAREQLRRDRVTARDEEPTLLPSMQDASKMKDALSGFQQEGAFTKEVRQRFSQEPKGFK